MTVTAPGMPEITPRPVNVEFPDDTPRFWYGDSPFISHFFDAFSTTLPVGEDLFIYSLRQVRQQISDPQLQKNISAFIGQEAFHSREHTKYNQLLKRWGYNIDGMDRSLARSTRIIRARLNTFQMLAVTLSCEHLTSILSAAILRGDFMVDADPHLKALWHWHAVEEIEHKAVAWDVYQSLGGTYRTRIVWMNFAMALIGVRVTARLLHMLRKDGLLFNGPVWREGLRFLFGRGGLVRTLKQDFLDFYRRDFHPWQHDTQHLTADWIRQYAQTATSIAPPRKEASIV